MVKLLLFDLDDTIFETKSIDTKAVAPLINGFKTALASFYDETTCVNILQDLWKLPFDHLATKYSLPSSLLDTFTSLLKKTNFSFSVQPFEDFRLVAVRRERKILVTTGFGELQHAKIAALDISSLFEEIVVDDLVKRNRIYKKGIFTQILAKSKLKKSELLIIGDNPNSELKAGHELGIPTVQLAKFGQPRCEFATHCFQSYTELVNLLESQAN